MSLREVIRTEDRRRLSGFGERSEMAWREGQKEVRLNWRDQVRDNLERGQKEVKCILRVISNDSERGPKRGQRSGER